MQIERIPLNPSPKELTVLALITLILATSTDVNYANRLRAEFFERYRQKLYEYCMHIANKNFGGTAEWKSNCEDIVQETFIFAIYNFDKFKFDAKWSETESDYKIMGWLGAIAQHKLFDEYSRDRGDEEGVEAAALNYDLKKKLYKAKTANEKEIFVMERHFLDAAMSQISARDKCVFYTYLKHGCLYGKRHIPDDILKSMCEKWGITESYARVIKLRTFEKLRKLCVEQKIKAA